MNAPSVVLIGFSTTGKSHYLKQIKKEWRSEFAFFDSDEFVSSEFDGHIYNVFMELGYYKALTYIETKENEFLHFITGFYDKPQLIAAGPVLANRNGWPTFIKNRAPFVIHLEKTAKSIYQALQQRRKMQSEILDITNANFGCWDKDVTTELAKESYIDISEHKALENIKRHLADNMASYLKCRNAFFDSDFLKSNIIKQQELIELIVNKLRKEST